MAGILGDTLQGASGFYFLFFIFFFEILRGSNTSGLTHLLPGFFVHQAVFTVS
jgi:hypothetical protein